MVVVLDLEDECIDPLQGRDGQALGKAKLQLKACNAQASGDSKLVAASQAQSQRDPNIGAFSAALACYPVVAQIARDLDLNSLHDLSRTCHLFRSCLLQHRKQLMSMTLRCSNSDDGRGSGVEREGRLQANRRNWHIMGYDSMRPRLTSGKVSPCAVDLVGECRRCGDIVCRNCTTKPMSSSMLSYRLRRLCNTCIRAPLSSMVAAHLDGGGDRPAFTYHAFAREPCSCPDNFFICRPCGRYLAAGDTDYKRIWTWRTRYSTYLGGLGTGIGEGYEGVKCGRAQRCLAARSTELELDCDAESAAGTPRDPDSRPASQQSGSDGSDGEKAGYFRQEVEGVGGALRGKVKRRVKVGQTVEEHEDERETGEYLGREARGACRSWCGWCDRVVPGRDDDDAV